MNSKIYKQLSLEHFVVFDIETTGLSSDKDEIIEIGMIRIENGTVTETYDQVFDPEITIPDYITKLTGITNQDCCGQPLLKDKISEIINFMGNGFVVAHNADFDIGFLNYALKKYTFEKAKIHPERILDSLDLSRFFLYHLHNHKLATLSEYFSVDTDSAHRALSDAKTCGLVFIKLLELSLELDKDIVRICRNVLRNTNFGIEIFFSKLYSYLQKSGSERKIIHRKGQDNIIGRVREKTEQEKSKKISSETLEDFFGSQGFLKDHLQNYEYRKQQHEMADSVRKVFNQNGFLLAEAGTGIGKSMAYLIPALLWVKENHQSKVVVSTNTKNLQDQLFSNELPLLQKIPSLQFLAILLKGRGNYLCQRAWEDLIGHPEKLSKKERKHILPLIIWNQKTITGDIEENSGFSRKRNSNIWRHLNCEKSNCTGRNCIFESTCFMNRVRKISQYADIIVVNHSLLFSDISAGNTILKFYDSLIIDEAHNIESSATRSFKLELNVWKFNEILRLMYQESPRKTGLFYFIQKNLKKVIQHNKDQLTLERILKDIIHKVQELHKHSTDFFKKLKDKNFPSIPSDNQYPQLRYTSKNKLFGDLELDAKEILLEVKHLNKESMHFNKLLKDMACKSEKEYYRWLRELESVVNQLEELEKLVDHFIKGDYKENIIWSVLTKSRKKREISIYSVPLDISGILETRLFSHLKRGVLTSATLRVNNSFDYFIKRAGLADFDPERIHSEFFGSPFNYSEQSMFIIPSYLPDPRDGNFITDVSNLLINTLENSSYGTMVLFTSYKMLKDVYRSLVPIFNAKNILLLGQGIDGSRSTLLKIFKDNRNSILFGTNSFWEGVDIPGTALEMLVITKIPFQVPTEPVFQARMERVNQESGNGFVNYAVPEAVIRLRQGIGRLIRSTGDRGVVLLLDQRLIKTRYGSFFTHSFPVEPVICKKEDLLQQKLKAWF
ncbi:MAG: helicase C-terminal domain-containing protein [bacterium]